MKNMGENWSFSRIGFQISLKTYNGLTCRASKIINDSSPLIASLTLSC